MPQYFFTKVLTIPLQDIAFNEICGKDFPGPRDDSDDDPTDQDWEDNDLTDDCVRTIDGMDVLINGTCLL